MSKIHIVFGRQGAGKTSYSQKLTKKINGVCFSIDQWMWNLYGKDLPKSMNLKWIMERVDRCEQQIWETSKQILKGEMEVVLDLGFTKYSKREYFYQLAKELSVDIQVHYLKAPYEQRKQRVMNRNQDKGATYSFEVTPGMFDFMEGEFQELRETERKGAVVLDTGESVL